MSLKRFLCVAPFALLAAIAVSADNNDDRDHGRNQDGKHHHRPIAAPEPASLLLLGSGLIGIAAKMRKKRAANQ